MRPITVQKQDETQTVVSKGLEPPERVVTTGFARLTDGAKVTISSPAAPEATAPAARQRSGAPGERKKGDNGTRPNAQQ